MPPDKPRLTSESKRTLLEQCLQLIFSRLSDKIESSGQNLPVFFTFVKTTVISKSFLSVAQDPGYDIYRFNFNYNCPGSALLYLTSKHYKNRDRKSIELLFDRDYKLAMLLQPPSIGANFGIGLKNPNNLEEFGEFLKITNGRVRLNVDWEISPFHNFLQHFAHRIHGFSCCVSLFNEQETLPLVAMEELNVTDVENSAQFLRVLQHNVRSLDLCFDDRFYADTSFFNLSKFSNEGVSLANKEVKHLSLGFWIDDGILDYNMFHCLFDKLIEFFPNLYELVIDAHFTDLAHLAELPSMAVDYTQYMNALKERLFGSGLKKLSVNFVHSICYREVIDYYPNWILQICNKNEFKNWKSEATSFNRSDNNNDYKHDHLKLNIEEDNRSKFGIRFEVSHNLTQHIQVFESDEEDFMEFIGGVLEGIYDRSDSEDDELMDRSDSEDDDELSEEEEGMELNDANEELI